MAEKLTEGFFSSESSSTCSKKISADNDAMQDKNLLQNPGRQLKSRTIEAYKKAYKAVFLQATNEIRTAEDDPAIPTLSDMVWSLKYNLTQLRANTLQLRKSALLWHIREYKLHGDKEVIHDLIKWKPFKVPMPSFPLHRKTRAPGRMIPKDDLEILSHQLLKMGEMGIRSHHMLMAGVTCGARPIEWVNSAWVSPNVIRILTAKEKNFNAWNAIPPGTFTDHEEFYGQETTATNEHSNGPSSEEIDFERRLSETDLDMEKDQELVEDLRKSRIGNSTTLFRDVSITVEDAEWVVLHMAAIKTVMIEVVGPEYADLPKEELEEAFRKFYFHPVRNVLWRACKKAFPDGRLYGLADARSTFAANRKRQFGLQQTALDMGHSGSRTTRGSYASGRQGWATKGLAQQNKNEQVDQQCESEAEAPSSQ